MTDLVRITTHDAGAFWQVTFGGARGNILDLATVNALSRTFVDARASSDLKAICLEGVGEDFSFGASIQEHLPDHVTAMIGGMRQLLFDMLECHVLVLAAVRGRCLGGGLEVASVCHRVFASPEATFGQPEIAIGVFAPFASVLLAERAGRSHAEDLCLTGRTIDCGEARAMGVVDEITDGDPAVSALAWARKYVVRHSASSLRLAVKALRAGLTARLREGLPAVEVIYLRELMGSHDAREGLEAFLAKRPALWKNR